MSPGGPVHTWLVASARRGRQAKQSSTSSHLSPASVVHIFLCLAYRIFRRGRGRVPARGHCKGGAGVVVFTCGVYGGTGTVSWSVLS